MCVRGAAQKLRVLTNYKLQTTAQKPRVLTNMPSSSPQGRQHMCVGGASQMPLTDYYKSSQSQVITDYYKTQITWVTPWVTPLGRYEQAHVVRTTYM